MSAPAVSAKGLVRRFGTVVAVDGLDLEIDAGTCLGLLGPNGAGKTTTIEMLEGLRRPDAGEIEILGMGWDRDGPRIRQRIGVQLQETMLQEKLNCDETLRVFASFYAHPRPRDEVMDIVGLVEKKGARVGTLSGGQKQRLALGCALINRPDLLFLDEPSTGLDPQARRRVWEVVEAFTSDGGTVLLTTHYMEEAERLSDRVIIIDQGRIIAEGSPQQIIDGLDAEAIVEFRIASDRNGADLPDGLFDDLPGAGSVRRSGDVVSFEVTDVQAAVFALLQRAKEHDVALDDLRTHRTTLEDVFVSLTGRQLRDG